MKLFMATILAISFFDLFNEGIIRGSVASQMLPMDSCTDLRTDEISFHRISDYEEHERPVKAVIFITKNGIRICVPHNLQWVKKTIKKLNRRVAQKTLRKTKSSTRSIPRTS